MNCVLPVHVLNLISFLSQLIEPSNRVYLLEIFCFGFSLADMIYF